MTNGAKMLMMANHNDEGHKRPNIPYKRFEGMGTGYRMVEPKGAYTPVESPENRRYKNGRFAPKGGEYEGPYWEEPEMRGNYNTSMRHAEYKENPQKFQMGFATGEEGEEVMPFSQMTAEKWTRNMENEDGTIGPHWNIEQVKQVMAQKGINHDPWEFYAALNSVYSDYSKVLKKHGVGDKLDVYIDLAKAFMLDKDAQPEKLAKYFEYIVKH